MQTISALGGEDMKKIIKVDRPETIAFRVSTEEKRIIESLAARQNRTVSQYLLGLALMDMLISGDLVAMKHSTKMLGLGAKIALRELLHGKEDVTIDLKGSD